MKTNTEKFPSLSFDGCGINGRDEYRTRICTFERDKRDKEAKEFGPMFAAAPELLAALENTADNLAHFERIYGTGPKVAAVLKEARATITKAKGGAA